MTPEQREELKQAAMKMAEADGSDESISAKEYTGISEVFENLSTHSAILSLIAQVEALTVPQWISVKDRLPAPGVLVMVWQPRQEWNYPDDLLISFDCIDPDDDDAATWRGHNNWYEEYCVIGKPEGSTGPSQEAPYTHWKAMDAAPTIPAIPGTKEGA